MPFPEGWPPRAPSQLRNIRFFVQGTATANYEDNAFLFVDDPGANPNTPVPYTAWDGSDYFGSQDHPFGTQPGYIEPYHPNVFLRGKGSGTVDTRLEKDGNVITLKDYTLVKPFNLSALNKEIVITGATTAGNNGTFKTTAVPDPNSISWVNAAGAAENLPTTAAWRLRMVDDMPKAAIWASNIRVVNLGGAALTISFDGVNDHGIVPPNSSETFDDRHEAGIAVKGSSDFAIEAW